MHPTEADTYVVSGEKFAIAAFRSVISLALQKCKSLATELCLPALSAEDLLSDNVQDQTPGYGLGSVFLAANSHTVQTSLLAFIKRHRLLMLDKRAVLRVYRSFSTPLLELLLWLMHVLSGQPGRASEMVEYTLVNLPTAPRTVMQVMSTIACVPWVQQDRLSVWYLKVSGKVLLSCFGFALFQFIKLDDALFQSYWCVIEIFFVNCSQLVAGWCKEDSDKVKELFKDLFCLMPDGCLKGGILLRCITLAFGAGIKCQLIQCWAYAPTLHVTMMEPQVPTSFKQTVETFLLSYSEKWPTLKRIAEIVLSIKQSSMRCLKHGNGIQFKSDHHEIDFFRYLNRQLQMY
ncbi:hypothetical protein MIR68_001145 [Amoeboaphelidium protococcarum]|nr:hypothetical protein MIR68_001145 [Amoeboaphelidium protococcarum]